MATSVQRKRLGNLFKTDDRIDIVSAYLKNKTIPKTFSRFAKATLIKQFDNSDWKLVKNRIIYVPLKLKVLKKDEKDKELEAIYNDLSKSLGKGIHSFYDYVSSKFVNITRKDVKTFLEKQGNFSITRRPVKTVSDEPIIALYPNHIWQCDTMFLDYAAADNPYTVVKNYEKILKKDFDLTFLRKTIQPPSERLREPRPQRFKYVFNIIDVFSKKAWSFPMLEERLDSLFTSRVLKYLIEKKKIAKPKIIIADNGREHRASFQDYAKEQKIQLIYGSPNKSTHQAHVERFNGSLREKIRNYFVAFNTFVWANQLPIFIDNYNNQKHSATGYTPNEIWRNSNKKLKLPLNEKAPVLTDSSTQDEKIFNVAYKNALRVKRFIQNRKQKETLKVGTVVRVTMQSMFSDIRQILKSNADFNKKRIAVRYLPEVFIINSIKREGSTYKRNRYTLKDLTGNVIHNNNADKTIKLFYEFDLKVVPDGFNYPTAIETIQNAYDVNGIKKDFRIIVDDEGRRLV